VLCPSSNFLKKHVILKDVSVSISRQKKKHLTWWTTWLELFSIIGHHRNTNLLKYVPEIRSSPTVVTRKKAIEKF